MNIGQLLKEARSKAGFTQEYVAESINVSRQTISNWENEKSYPDIMSVVSLSDLYEISLDDLYNVSLDDLLKGDDKMLKHVEESTNIIASNKKLVLAIGINILLITLLMIFSKAIPNNGIYLVGIFSLSVITVTFLLYQIIKRI